MSLKTTITSNVVFPRLPSISRLVLDIWYSSISRTGNSSVLKGDFYSYLQMCSSITKEKARYLPPNVLLRFGLFLSSEIKNDTMIPTLISVLSFRFSQWIGLSDFQRPYRIKLVLPLSVLLPYFKPFLVPWYKSDPNSFKYYKIA